MSDTVKLHQEIARKYFTFFSMKTSFFLMFANSLSSENNAIRPGTAQA